MTEFEEKNYKRLIKEKGTPNPFFRGYEYCGQLIGSFTTFDLNRGRVKRGGILCSQCKKRTCVKCREQFHPGPCVPDAALAELPRSGNIRRCPLCGEAIEKNGGCRHMQCPTCSSHWWWTKEGIFENYELHRHRLHLGPEEEALVNRDLGLGDDEEVPVWIRLTLELLCCDLMCFVSNKVMSRLERMRLLKRRCMSHQ